MQLIVSKEIMKIEKEMTTNSHNKGNRGSEEDHSRRKMKKEDAKVNGKRMSQGELDKEIVELKEQFNVLRMILEENQRQGWVLRKNAVKCLSYRESYKRSK